MLNFAMDDDSLDAPDIWRAVEADIADAFARDHGLEGVRVFFDPVTERFESQPQVPNAVWCVVVPASIKRCFIRQACRRRTTTG